MRQDIHSVLDIYRNGSPLPDDIIILILEISGTIFIGKRSVCFVHRWLPSFHGCLFRKIEHKMKERYKRKD